MLMDHVFLLIFDKDKNSATPENLRKQIDVISEKTNIDVIYVHPALSSFQRERLIKYKINFVVPDNQMYLPYLKIDLREHFKSLHQKNGSLSPASQAIIIFSILNKYSQLDSHIIMNNLNYTAMSVSRSFREISNHEIGDLKKNGKENSLHLPESKRQIWMRSLDFMKSPIMKEVWLHELPPNYMFPVAGLSALAEYSMIAPPQNLVYAIHKKNWYKIAHDKLIKKLIEPIQTGSNIKLQVWSYPLDLCKNSNIVDKYSLYLSFKNETNERIEQALEEMMEEELNG